MPTEAEKAYLVLRAQRMDKTLPLDYDRLMALPMNRVPIELINEVLESGMIEVDHSLHRMKELPTKRKKQK